jgi:hypothetical protein
MILSALMGVIFWKETNPFLRVDKRQKIVSLGQLSLVIALISFISSFIRISMYELYGGILFSLIIVNCPLLFLLLWKREEKFLHLILLISSFLIITFISYQIEMIIDPISGGHPIEQYTIFPPLSYPLMASHEEIFIHPPPGPFPYKIYYNSTYNIGILLPFLSIQLPYESHSLSSNMVEYQTILELLIMRNQFFLFLFYFLLNFLTTLTVLKIYSKRSKKININRILESASHIAITLVNILFISIIITGSLDYFIYRYFGDVLMETHSIFNLGLLIIIFVGLILFFLKKPILQGDVEYQFKGLFFLSIVGFLLISSVLVADIVSPHPDIHLVKVQAFITILINMIIIIMNILILYKSLNLKQEKTFEEHVFPYERAF